MTIKADEKKEVEGEINPEKTDVEIAAEERATAAEARASEKEAELDKIRSELSTRSTNTPPSSGYSISSFSEQEWSDAEATTGMDRKAILFGLNQSAKIDSKVKESIGVLETRLSIQEEKEAIASEDPLYPK